MSNEQPDEPAAGPSTQGTQGRRPSLNAGSGGGPAWSPSGHGESSTSILQALSNTIQMEPVSFTAPRPLAWKPWAAAAVVVALVAAGWAAFVGSRSTPPASPSHVVADAQQPLAKAVVPIPEAATTSATASAAPPPSVAAAASAVARIEDLPPTVVALSPAPAVDTSASRPAVVTDAQPTATRPDRPAPAARPRVARQEARPESRQEARSEAPRRKDVKLAMVDGRSGESPSQAAARSASTSAATRQDSDVDLMAALLDHMAATDAAGSNAAATTQEVRKAAVATRAAPSNATRPTTISGLVASCKEAGDKRAVSDCRKRICKGYWGKAQACPARLAPTAAARKRSDG